MSSHVSQIEQAINIEMIENLPMHPHFGYRETKRKTKDDFNRLFFEKL